MPGSRKTVPDETPTRPVAGLARLVRRYPKRAAALAMLAVFGAWVLTLSIHVIVAFEGRRWDIPAHVYAAPLELHAGLNLPADAVAATLAQIGYEQVEAPAKPGEYRVEPSRIELWTREFRHWDVAEPALRAVIDFADEGVSGMRDESGAPLPLLRLEPVRLGSLFASHHEDRILVDPEEIPPLLVSALIAIEDRRFERHNGLDFLAIGRAALVNLRHGEIRQGGSTLTQQLVKSYFLDGRRTFRRKFREAVMAVALELRYGKQELLQAYVNEVYLGQQGARAIHGFGLASEFYFGRPLPRLELQEVALLVGLVRGPSYYDPRRQPERALGRRNLVIATLADAGVITEDEARDAAATELGVNDGSGLMSRYQPAYMDLVRRQLAADYPLDDLETQGLRIFTSLEPQVQALAERELAGGIERLQAGGAASAGIEGSIVVTRPKTGEVIAMVGGRDVEFDGFNRALDARRPAGSLIKPAVYLAALETGAYTIASRVSDEPVEVVLDNGDTWAPQNFDRESHADVPLLRALADSYNQATVRLGMEIGVEAVARLLESLGLPRRPAANPSLLLGALDVSPFEIAQVYGTLASGGFRVPLRAVRSVIDSEGQPLIRYPLELVPAADPAAVQQLNLALVQVIEHGTGRSARSILPESLKAAGKTGTSDDLRDSWFAGFTDDYLAVAWLGRDDNAPIGLTGSSGALGIWAPLVAGLPGARSYEPSLSPGLDLVWLDYETGLGTYEGCGTFALVALPAGHRPKRLDGCGRGLRELGSRTRRLLQGGGR